MSLDTSNNPDYQDYSSSLPQEGSSTTGPGVQPGVQTGAPAFTDQIDQANAMLASQNMPLGDAPSDGAPKSPGSPRLTRPIPTPPQTLTQAGKALNKAGSFATFTQAKLALKQQAQASGPFPSTGGGYAADLPDASEEVKQLAQQYGTSESSVQSTIQESGNALIELALSGSPEADKLLNAHFNPQLAKALTPQQQAKLASVQATVNGAMGVVAHGKGGKPLTKGAVPTSPKTFNAKVNGEHADKVQKGINKLAFAGLIKPEDGVKMMTGFLLPALSALPGSMKLMLGTLQGQAKQEIEAQYGFLPGKLPSPDATNHAAAITVNFMNKLQAGVSGEFSKIPPGQLSALVAKYVMNSEDPTVPSELKAKLANTMPGVRAAVLSEYGLSEEWQPAMSAVNISGIDAVALNTALKQLGTVHDMVASALSVAKRMPPGPEQGSYLNFLKAIATALNTLQQSIYAMQQSNANIQNVLDDLQTAIAKGNIQIQQDAQSKVQHRSSKMPHIAGPLGDLIDDIIKAVIVVCGAIMAPVTAGASLALSIDYVAQGNKSVVQKAIDGAVKAAGKAGFAVGMILCWEMAATNPLMMWQVFTQSGSLQNLIATCGGNKTDQMIGAMAIQATTEIAVMIAITVAMSVGGPEADAAGAALIATEITGDVAEVTTAVAATTGEAAAAGAEAGAVASEATGVTSEVTADAASDAAQVAQNAANAAADATQVTTEASTAAARAAEEESSVAEMSAAAAASAAKSTAAKLKLAFGVLEMAFGGVQAASSGISVADNILMAQIAEILGKEESFIAQADAVMTTLQDLVKKLLAALNSNGEWIGSISTQVGSMYSAASQQTTGISNSLAA